MPTDFRDLLRQLNEAQVRYVVVGGLAMLLHGVDRLTADLDLVVDLVPAEAERAVRALLAAGMKPMVPVDPLRFADAATRAHWREQQGMVVLSFWDPGHRRPTVDVFTDNPLPFDLLWSTSEVLDAGGAPCRVASIAHLIALKRLAGRPRDLEDVRRLEQFLKDRDA